ncbi:MAG: M23 family metallopeptidase [Bacteroides sp.]|nr:M23 family metallopeptidase [Bacteroides sp.]
MKAKSRYIITIENESRLENVFRVSMSPWKITLTGAVILILLLSLGALILYITPAHTLLPGYLKDSERAETEEQHMRLDSLQNAYQINDYFLSNIMHVLDTEREVFSDVKTENRDSLRYASDSIIPTSQEERNFVAMMRERDKYNISIVAPLAAESMMFSSVNEESIISDDSRHSTKAKIIISKRSPVAAIADGTVISVSQSLKEGGGTAVLIQHPKGFLSRCSRLGTVLIEAGDKVSGGQIIALTTNGNARNNEIINIEMWHNGTPLIPYEYLGEPNSDSFLQ